MTIIIKEIKITATIQSKPNHQDKVFPSDQFKNELKREILKEINLKELRNKRYEQIRKS